MVAVLRHNALTSQLAGMGENGVAVPLDVLVELDPRQHLGEQSLQLCLPLLKSPSHHTASPSIVTDGAWRAATAALISGYRSVQSYPRRVNKRTLSSRLRAIRR
jgi:hypothetical protein